MPGARAIFSDRLVEAATPAALPGKKGDWRLNRLQWALLRSSLAASRENARLSALLRREDDGADMRFSGPERLRHDRGTDAFDCGAPELNRLLRETLRDENDPNKPNLSTFVLREGDRIAAYYATRAIVARCGAERLPLLLLARFAVDRRWQRPGVSRALFAHLLRRAALARAPSGPVAVVGFALSPAAKLFFRRCGARPLGDVVEPRGMMVPLADVDAALRPAA